VCCLVSGYLSLCTLGMNIVCAFIRFLVQKLKGGGSIAQLQWLKRPQIAMVRFLWFLYWSSTIPFDVVKYFCPIYSKSIYDMISIWQHIDKEIATTPMIEAYPNKLVIIPHPLPCGKPHLSLCFCCCNWNKQKWITRLTRGKKAWVMENKFCFQCFWIDGLRGSKIWWTCYNEHQMMKCGWLLNM
jgi:hypothetical protein